VPELPEINLYLDAFRRRIEGSPLRAVRLRSPSLLKTWDPPLPAAEGCRVTGISRMGKRIVWTLEPDLFLVFHLMVTGRFQWRPPGARVPRRAGHAAFDFDDGTVLLTEQGPKKRASLHLVRGRDALAELDPGGVEPLEVDEAGFREALIRENRTLKRALTDPRILSGIGNAHSDEILLRAGLSPVQRTRNLSGEEVGRLYRATQSSLREWMERLREETGSDFPSRITAFHPQMTAHGKYGEPCPRCGEPIQRIRYAGRETNYCPTCQTGGRLLADRALSRLLGEDWPRTVEELESLRRSHRGGAGAGASA
jgi:formamidopyrimidine-DNA glycosylase